MSKNKTKFITIRSSIEEIERFDLQAQAVGLSRSAYLRRKLEGLPIRPTVVPPVNWQTYRELGAIALELGKINKCLASSEGSEIAAQAIADKIQQLQQLIKETRLEVTGSLEK